VATWVAGLIAIKEIVCDGCGRVIEHAERYGYIKEEGKPPRRLCEDCSRAEGYLKWRKDDKGHEVETFL
jgi:phage FluMu protein Com